MDEASERLMQEALHPVRRTRRVFLEPDAHDEGSEELHFDGGQMDTVIRLIPVDLDELAGLLLARRGPGATAAEVREFLRGLHDRCEAELEPGLFSAASHNQT